MYWKVRYTICAGMPYFFAPPMERDSIKVVKFSGAVLLWFLFWLLRWLRGL